MVAKISSGRDCRNLQQPLLRDRQINRAVGKGGPDRLPGKQALRVVMAWPSVSLSQA
jgi:hypothetical protein